MATNINWLSSASGDWSTFTNWVGRTVPASGFDATIDTPNTVTINGGAAASQLNILKSTVNLGGTLTVKTLNIETGSSLGCLNLVGGTLNVNSIIGNFGILQGAGVVNGNLSGDVSINALDNSYLVFNGVSFSTTFLGNSFFVNQNATLELNGASSGNSIFMNGANAVLKLDTPAYFANSIKNFNIGNNIDLVGIKVSAVSYSGTTLTVKQTNGQSLFYQVSGTLSPYTPGFTSDGNGGSYVYFGDFVQPSATVPVNSSYFARPNQKITGGSGVESVAFYGASTNFNIKLTGTTATTVDNVGGYGSNTIINVERLKFTDATVALDIGPSQIAGSAYMLYQAAFNRTPDKEGLGYWMKQMDSGMNINTVALYFMGEAEFKAAYGGSNPSVNTLVNLLYNNALHRTADAEGLSFWQTQINTGAYKINQVLAYFATSDENATYVTPLVAQGINYVQYVG